MDGQVGQWTDRWTGARTHGMLFELFFCPAARSLPQLYLQTWSGLLAGAVPAASDTFPHASTWLASFLFLFFPGHSDLNPNGAPSEKPSLPTHPHHSILHLTCTNFIVFVAFTIQNHLDFSDHLLIIPEKAGTVSLFGHYLFPARGIWRC